MKSHCGMTLTGEGKELCPSATLFITNPTWTDPGRKPGLHGESPTKNRLSHSTARLVGYFVG